MKSRFYVVKPKLFLEIVGSAVALLLYYHTVEYGAPLGMYHMIGHGLGAHIAAVAASKITYGCIPQITGMLIYKMQVLYDLSLSRASYRTKIVNIKNTTFSLSVTSVNDRRKLML